MNDYITPTQRACEAARHWDEYAAKAYKRKLATQKNNAADSVVVIVSEKGCTRDLVSRDFNAGKKLTEAARKLWLRDPEQFERVAAGLEPLPMKKEDKHPCVYFIGHENRPDLPIKIGKANSVTSRRADLQTAHYTQLVILFTLPGYSKLEKELHGRFTNKHVRGEWFSLTQDDLELIKKEFSYA